MGRPSPNEMKNVTLFHLMVMPDHWQEKGRPQEARESRERIYISRGVHMSVQREVVNVQIAKTSQSDGYPQAQEKKRKKSERVPREHSPIKNGCNVNYFPSKACFDLLLQGRRAPNRTVLWFQQ